MAKKKDILVCKLTKKEGCRTLLCNEDQTKCHYCYGVLPSHEKIAESCGEDGLWVRNKGHYAGRCVYNSVVHLVRSVR
jgi:hypothetical protein